MPLQVWIFLSEEVNHILPNTIEPMNCSGRKRNYFSEKKDGPSGTAQGRCEKVQGVTVFLWSEHVYLKMGLDSWNGFRRQQLMDGYTQDWTSSSCFTQHNLMISVLGNKELPFL